MSRKCMSIDMMAESKDDPTRSGVFSDGGAGAEKIRAFDERRDGNYYTERADECRKELRRKRRGYLIPVFDLIVENGKFRQDSIAELAATKHMKYKAAELIYVRHRKKILFFFKAQ